MSCEHTSTIIKTQKWGNSIGSITKMGTSEAAISHNANVDLLFCENCQQYLLHDWHVDKYLEIDKEMV